MHLEHHFLHVPLAQLFEANIRGELQEVQGQGRVLESVIEVGAEVESSMLVHVSSDLNADLVVDLLLVPGHEGSAEHAKGAESGISEFLFSIRETITELSVWRVTVKPWPPKPSCIITKNVKLDLFGFVGRERGAYGSA